jgi:hypothetical protein
VAIYGSVKQYGSDETFTTMPLVTLVEPIGPTSPTTPAVPPVPAPLPSPVSPPRGPSLQVAQRGNSLSIVLGLDRRAARVEVDATVPSLQLGVTKPKGHRGPFVLARLVRTKVEAGRLKFLLTLDMARIRELGRRQLRLTITAKITPFSGAQQKTFRTLVLV